MGGIINYVQDGIHNYYAPQHFKATSSFALDPNDSVLIFLDQHARLEKMSTNILCGKCGQQNRSCCFSNHETLAIHVINCSADEPGNEMHIFIPANSTLHKLLSLPQIQSQWVTCPSDYNQQSAILKTLHVRKMRQEEEEDSTCSCTNSCDHSDIDDGVFEANNDNNNNNNNDGDYYYNDDSVIIID